MSHGLSPVRLVLPQGVVVQSVRTTRTPAVAINLAIRGGAASDPVSRDGVTALLGDLLERGTLHRTDAVVAEMLDARGVAVSVTVTPHHTLLTCTVLSDDFDDVFALLIEMVRLPALPAEALDVRRRALVTATREADDDPAERADLTLRAALYGTHHPYGRRVTGTVESLRAMTRADLVAQHHASVVPAAVSIVVVGDVLPTQVASRAADLCDGWRSAPPIAPTLPPCVPATGRGLHVETMADKAQAEIAYGWVGIARRDPAYEAVTVLNTILGQFALGGRLGDNIRERQGMAYHVSSDLDATLGAGPLTIRAGVAAANVERTIAAIDAEVIALRRDGVTARELEDTQQYLVGSMPRALETSEGIARFLQRAELFGLGLDYDVQMPARIRAVTRAEVHAAAERWLDPAVATMVVAGPYPT